MTGIQTFEHRFEPGRSGNATPLLLLHGTGGDENDLLPLGRTLAPHAPLLSPRGKVLEHGMPRFFRRFDEGVFDEQDVRHRADELADFVNAARKEYGIGRPIAVGYSNGANIAAAVLLTRPDAFAGAVLLRAMVPLSDPPRPDLAGKSVLLLTGRMDPIAPAENAGRLASLLRQGGANVDHRTVPAGHALSHADVAAATTWLANLRSPAMQEPG